MNGRGTTWSWSETCSGWRARSWRSARSAPFACCTRSTRSLELTSRMVLSGGASAQQRCSTLASAPRQRERIARHPRYLPMRLLVKARTDLASGWFRWRADQLIALRACVLDPEQVTSPLPCDASAMRCWALTLVLPLPGWTCFLQHRSTLSALRSWRPEKSSLALSASLPSAPKPPTPPFPNPTILCGAPKTHFPPFPFSLHRVREYAAHTAKDRLSCPLEWNRG